VNRPGHGQTRAWRKTAILWVLRHPLQPRWQVSPVVALCKLAPSRHWSCGFLPLLSASLPTAHTPHMNLFRIGHKHAQRSVTLLACEDRLSNILLSSDLKVQPPLATPARRDMRAQSKACSLGQLCCKKPCGLALFTNLDFEHFSCLHQGKRWQSSQEMDIWGRTCIDPESCRRCVSASASRAALMRVLASMATMTETASSARAIASMRAPTHLHRWHIHKQSLQVGIIARPRVRMVELCLEFDPKTGRAS
jgi:hypothetical protein